MVRSGKYLWMIGVPMNQVRCDDLRFDVWIDGPPGGEAVVLLHGFPQDATSWSGIVKRLTARGFHTVAPDQRGYSPGARPAGVSAYKLDLLGEDVLRIADAQRIGEFHVVGHDWGGAVAWNLAARHPARILSLTSLSTPHPAAYRRALFTSPQALRALYIPLFAVPGVPERVLSARGGFLIERGLIASGLGAGAARRYASRMSSPGALGAAFNWYRAALLGGSGGDLPPVECPALLVWGSRDAAIDRQAVEGTARHADGRYRLEILAGAGHWLPENHHDRIVPLLVDHLAAAGAP